jgi:hypothetical protein
MSEDQFRKYLWALLADNRPLAFATGTLPEAAEALLADREERQRAAEGYAELVAALKKAPNPGAAWEGYYHWYRETRRDALARVTGAGT